MRHLRQTRFDLIAEILVVGLDEPGLVKRADPVRFISTGKPEFAPVSRNIGIRQAESDLLVFMDSDCVATPNWLQELVVCHNAKRSVIAGSVSLQTEDYKSLCYNLALFPDMLPTSPGGTRASVPSLNLLIARNVGSGDEQASRLPE